MSLVDKVLAEDNGKNLSIAQVPVQTENTVPVAAPPVMEKKSRGAAWGEKQKQKDALIAAQAEKLAQLETLIRQMSVNQAPAVQAAPIVAAPIVAAPVAPVAPVQMTHLTHYEAGINKRTGIPYGEGYKFHAKPHPVGQTAYGGWSIDDLVQVRKQFPKGQEAAFFKLIDAILANDEIMKTTKAYQRYLAEKNKVVL